MEEGATGGVLTSAQLHQIESAIAEVANRCGWGQVIVVIEHGKPRRLIPAPSLEFELEPIE